MNDKFDELAKGLAQSVTRRGALKEFGVGLAGFALASVGLANKAEAGPSDCDLHCKNKCKNRNGFPGYWDCYNSCYDHCVRCRNC